MDYEALAVKELGEIKFRVNMLILHMQEVASMQKLRMMQEFCHTVNGFDADIMRMAKKANEKAVAHG